MLNNSNPFTSADQSSVAAGGGRTDLVSDAFALSVSGREPDIVGKSVVSVLDRDREREDDQELLSFADGVMNRLSVTGNVVVAVNVALTQRLADRVSDIVFDSVGKIEALREVVGDAVAEGLRDDDGDDDAERLRVGDAERVRETDCVPLSVEGVDGVTLDVAEAENEADALSLSDNDAEGVNESDRDPVGLAEGVDDT